MRDNQREEFKDECKLVIITGRNLRAAASMPASLISFPSRRCSTANATIKMPSGGQRDQGHETDLRIYVEA